MAVSETDVIELQHAASNATPLFLIHDGGGTVLSYLTLGDLGRNVYGIQDPKLECDDGWEGGIREMALEYIKLIQTTRIAGPILLGGWSLGGLVSLQIARLLDDERQHVRAEHSTQHLFVAGVVLIDSPYTLPWREHRDRFVDFNPEFPPWTPERMRTNVMRRFEVCDELIDTWDPPYWDAYLGHEGEKSILHASHVASSDEVSAQTDEGSPIRPASCCPPVVLLKATARVPLTNSNTGKDALLDVDLFRDDAHLGWARHAENMLQAVHHLSGHHFELFEQDDRVEAITKILTETCAGWDTPNTGTVAYTAGE